MHRNLGVRVARRLHAAEHAVDQAILDATALLTTMIEVRKEANVAAEVGQNALEDAVTGLTSLTQARRGMIASHAALLAVADDLHIGWRMDGPLEQKVPPARAANAA